MVRTMSVQFLFIPQSKQGQDEAPHFPRPHPRQRACMRPRQRRRRRRGAGRAEIEQAVARTTRRPHTALPLHQFWLGAAMPTKQRREANALQSAWDATLGT